MLSTASLSVSLRPRYQYTWSRLPEENSEAPSLSSNSSPSSLEFWLCTSSDMAAAISPAPVRSRRYSKSQLLKIHFPTSHALRLALLRVWNYSDIVPHSQSLSVEYINSNFFLFRGTQFIPAFFLIVGLPFLPRSPRWLAMVGREKEAIETLANIQAGGNTEDPLVIAEWEEIVTMMQAEREAGRGWRKFFKNGMWKRTMAGMSVQAWQVSRIRFIPQNGRDSIG